MSKKRIPRNINENNKDEQLRNRVRLAEKSGYSIMQKFSVLAGHRITTGYYAMKDLTPATKVIPTIGQLLTSIGF